MGSNFYKTILNILSNTIAPIAEYVIQPSRSNLNWPKPENRSSNPTQARKSPEIRLIQNHSFNCSFEHAFRSTTLQNYFVNTE